MSRIVRARPVEGEAVQRRPAAGGDPVAAVAWNATLFTIFAMRRGVMIVGESESKSFMNDISRLPLIIFHFIAFIPNEVSSMLRRGAYLAALLAIIGFGIFSELMIWAITNKAYWTFGGGKSYPLLKYWGVDGIILLLITVFISWIVYNMQRKR